jgi:4-amino-4-deoxychorismate lyase
MLTDSYYGNIVLWKDGIWYTPESHLLAGTQRASLLDNKLIQAIPIRVDNLKEFEKVKIINSMLDLENGPEVLIEDVRL